MSKKLLRYLYYGIPVSILLWLLVGFLSARYVTAPNPVEIPNQVKIGAVSGQEVSFQSEDGTSLRAWWVDNQSDWSVILLAGIRGNRTDMVTRAQLYSANGYNVLLPDLRGTGESEGEVITFGWHESRDLIAAMDFLQLKGQKNIGVHGISLGAATIAYSLRFHPEYRFIVLESPYDNIDHAWEHRMEKYPVPLFAAAPMRWFTVLRTGVKADSLSPQHFVQLAQAPILHLAGDEEVQIPVEETEAVFKNCGSSDKTLYLFKGAGHEDLYAHAPAEYINILSPFICRFQCLQPPPPGSTLSPDTPTTFGSSQDSKKPALPFR